MYQNGVTLRDLGRANAWLPRPLVSYPRGCGGIEIYRSGY